jgi:hypothetical protein
MAEFFEGQLLKKNRFKGAVAPYRGRQCDRVMTQQVKQCDRRIWSLLVDLGVEMVAATKVGNYNQEGFGRFVWTRVS